MMGDAIRKLATWCGLYEKADEQPLDAAMKELRKARAEVGDVLEAWREEPVDVLNRIAASDRHDP